MEVVDSQYDEDEKEEESEEDEFLYLGPEESEFHPNRENVHEQKSSRHERYLQRNHEEQKTRNLRTQRVFYQEEEDDEMLDQLDESEGTLLQKQAKKRKVIESSDEEVEQLSNK